MPIGSPVRESLIKITPSPNSVLICSYLGGCQNTVNNSLIILFLAHKILLPVPYYFSFFSSLFSHLLSNSHQTSYMIFNKSNENMEIANLELKVSNCLLDIIENLKIL